MPTPQTNEQPIETNESFEAVAPFYDHLMSSVPYRFWVSYLEQVWQYHNDRPKTILDVACGTGVVTRLLSRRKYEVTGIDLAPKMIERAREKNIIEDMNIDYYVQDAAEINLPDKNFDAAISLFDSLNYILHPERFAMAMQRVYDHLKPGGSFIFDLNTEFAFEVGMFNQSCTRRDEPLHYRWRSRYRSDTRICTVNMHFSYDSGDGERKTFKEVHRQRAYAKNEVTNYMKRAGFVDVEIYDAYTIEPPRSTSDRIFFYGSKPL